MGWKRDKYKSEHSGSNNGSKPKLRCGYTGKVSFNTEAGAINRGGEILDDKRNRTFTPNQWRAYKCQYCSKFHLTST